MLRVVVVCTHACDGVASGGDESVHLVYDASKRPSPGVSGTITCQCDCPECMVVASCRLVDSMATSSE